MMGDITPDLTSDDVLTPQQALDRRRALVAALQQTSVTPGQGQLASGNDAGGLPDGYLAKLVQVLVGDVNPRDLGTQGMDLTRNESGWVRDAAIKILQGAPQTPAMLATSAANPSGVTDIPGLSGIGLDGIAPDEIFGQVAVAGASAPLTQAQANGRFLNYANASFDLPDAIGDAPDLSIGIKNRGSDDAPPEDAEPIPEAGNNRSEPSPANNTMPANLSGMKYMRYATDTTDNGIDAPFARDKKLADSLNDGVYRTGTDNPGFTQVYKIEGAGSVHENITRAAATAAGLEFDRGLDVGVAWNDVPCENPHVIDTCYKDTYNNLDKPGTLANRSHHGDLQFWHSMSPRPGMTNEQVRSEILDQARNWYETAIRDGSTFCIGKILHMVQDSYSVSHVSRGDAGINFFEDYNMQDPDKHASADERVGRQKSWQDIPGVRSALDASTQLLILYRDKAPSSKVVNFLRENVYRFAPGSADKPAGGSLQQYLKRTAEEKGNGFI